MRYGHSQTLENVQNLAVKFAQGLRHVPYEATPRQLGLFSLARRKVRGDLICMFEIADGLLCFQQNADFNVHTHFGLRDHAFKIHQQCPT